MKVYPTTRRRRRREEKDEWKVKTKERREVGKLVQRKETPSGKVPALA
jgi:hypothetical protein